jgi:hypothetical protein
VRAALEAIAAPWDVKLAECDVGAVEAGDRLVLAGASAIAATIGAFAAGTALDWADQVTVVASAPGERQLAAAATALLNGQRAARIVSAAETTKAIRGARLVASADATAADREAAEKLVG